MAGFDIGGAFGSIIAALVWLAFALALSWGLVRFLTRKSAEDPRAVLAERLALGEITRAEFDTAMHALGYGDPER